MTPPDSGEHRPWCSGIRIDQRGASLGCDCKPDSGEREVDARWREKRCQHGRAYSGRCCTVCHPPPVRLPLSLAQRILAALEGCGEVVGPGMIFPRHADLAAELRALVTR